MKTNDITKKKDVSPVKSVETTQVPPDSGSDALNKQVIKTFKSMAPIYEEQINLRNKEWRDRDRNLSPGGPPNIKQAEVDVPSPDLTKSDKELIHKYSQALIKDFPVLDKPEGLVNSWSIKLWIDNSPLTRGSSKQVKKALLEHFETRTIKK